MGLTRVAPAGYWRGGSLQQARPSRWARASRSVPVSRPPSPQAQLIAQSIGQAFSVAYQEFLRANGINPEDLSQKEYSDVISTQEMYNDDLVHFSKSENCKEVSVRPRVARGWGWASGASRRPHSVVPPACGSRPCVEPSACARRWSDTCSGRHRPRLAGPGDVSEEHLGSVSRQEGCWAQALGAAGGRRPPGGPGTF